MISRLYSNLQEISQQWKLCLWYLVLDLRAHHSQKMVAFCGLPVHITNSSCTQENRHNGVHRYWITWSLFAKLTSKLCLSWKVIRVWPLSHFPGFKKVLEFKIRHCTTLHVSLPCTTSLSFVFVCFAWYKMAREG